MKEFEAELSYLLGHHDEASEPESRDSEKVIIKNRLIPLVEQLIEMTTEEYGNGQGQLSDTTSWSQRLAELKVQVADTKAERVEIVQELIILLKTMEDMANQRYKAGEVTMKDVLMAQIHKANAQLWLAKFTGDSR